MQPDPRRQHAGPPATEGDLVVSSQPAAEAIGDLAVVAAVSAEHRAEAFTVCRELVDRFKAEVPVWKHQHFTDGGDEWVGLT